MRLTKKLFHLRTILLILLITTILAGCGEPDLSSTATLSASPTPLATNTKVPPTQTPILTPPPLPTSSRILLTPTPAPTWIPPLLDEADRPPLPSAYPGELPERGIVQLGIGSSYVFDPDMRAFPSPDNSLAAFRTMSSVFVFQVDPPELLWSEHFNDGVGEIQWSPDGSMLAVPMRNSEESFHYEDSEYYGDVELSRPTVELRAARSGEAVGKLDDINGRISSLEWSGNSRYLSVGSKGSQIQVYDVATQELITTRGELAYGYQFRPNSAFNTDNRFFAHTVNDFASITVEDIRTDETIAEYRTASQIHDFIWDVHHPERLIIGISDARDENKRLIVWDVVADTVIAEQPVDSMSWGGSLSWSPDGRKFLVQGSRLITLWNWDLQVSEQKEINDFIDEYMWSIDGRFLVVMSNGSEVLTHRFMIFDVQTGQELYTREDMIFQQFHPDGYSLIVYDLTQKAVVVLDPITGAQRGILDGYGLISSQEVASVAWSPDGSQVAVGELALHDNREQNTITIWDATTGEPRINFLHQRSGNQYNGPKSLHMFWTEDSVISVFNNIQFYDPLTEELQYRVTIPLRDFVETVALSPDKTSLAIGTYDGQIIIYDIAADTFSRLGDLGSDIIIALAWSPDGESLAITTTPSTYMDELPTGLLVLDIAAQEKLWLVPLFNDNLPHTGYYRYNTQPGLAWSPDGSQIAIGGRDNYLRIYDSITGELLSEIDADISPYPKTVDGNGSDRISSLIWSDDGQMIAVGYGSHDSNGAALVAVWDAETGELLHSFQWHTTEVQDIVFSPDGLWLASASRDGTVMIWDIR